MLIEDDAIEGARRVIDVSGDGANNVGPPVIGARDEAVARGITINGLPIVISAYGAQADLDRYYEDCVIGGEGAFMMVARTGEELARTIRRKLILEISGLAPPPRLIPAAVRANRLPDRREAVPPAQLGPEGAASPETPARAHGTKRTPWMVYSNAPRRSAPAGPRRVGPNFAPPPTGIATQVDYVPELFPVICCDSGEGIGVDAMKIIAALLCACVMLAAAVSVAGGPAHALNGCNPQVSKC